MWQKCYSRQVRPGTVGSLSRSFKSRATVSSQRGQVVSIPHLSGITPYNYMLQKLISRRVQTRALGLPGFCSVSIHRVEALAQEQHIENSRSLMTLPQAHLQGRGSTPGEANLEVQRQLLLAQNPTTKAGVSCTTFFTPGSRVMAQIFYTGAKPALKLPKTFMQILAVSKEGGW